MQQTTTVQYPERLQEALAQAQRFIDTAYAAGVRAGTARMLWELAGHNEDLGKIVGEYASGLLTQRELLSEYAMLYPEDIVDTYIIERSGIYYRGVRSNGQATANFWSYEAAERSAKQGLWIA